MIRQRIRIRFAKRDDLRFIGHRDFMESFFRLLRRASIRPAMSEGFHPKPRVSFPAALPLGVEGEDEILEMEMNEPTDTAALCNQLRRVAIPGLEFVGAELLPSAGTKARVKIFEYVFAVPTARREALSRRIAWLGEQDTFTVNRVGREDKTTDLKRCLLSLALDDEGRLCFRLRADIAGGCGPRDILTAMEIADLESQGGILVRRCVIIDPE